MLTNHSIEKRGIAAADTSRLLGLGFKAAGLNSFTRTTNAWVGTDGDYTNEFTNNSGENVVLVIWGVAGSWVGGLNPTQPLITYSLAPGEATTISFADGASGGWAGIYGDTTMSLGQVFNTWGEYTFSGSWSTVDVSREPNMNGRNMTIVTPGSGSAPGCVSDMDTCVFVCKGGATSCWQDYQIINCNAANGGGADAIAMNGGCNGIGKGAKLRTYL